MTNKTSSLEMENNRTLQEKEFNETVNSHKSILIDIQDYFSNVHYLEGETEIVSVSANFVDYEPEICDAIYLILPDLKFTTVKAACKKFSKCENWLNFLTSESEIDVTDFNDPDVSIHLI